MSGIFCGLCKKKVESWPEHRDSEEHQRNLADEGLVSSLYLEAQMVPLKNLIEGAKRDIENLKKGEDDVQQF